VKLAVKESGRSRALFSCDPSIPVTASVHSAVYIGLKIVGHVPTVGITNTSPLQLRLLVYFSVFTDGAKDSDIEQYVNELQEIRKKAVVVWTKTLSRKFQEETEENHKTSQLKLLQQDPYMKPNSRPDIAAFPSLCAVSRLK
jgi:hypothetical protein